LVEVVVLGPDPAFAIPEDHRVGGRADAPDHAAGGGQIGIALGIRSEKAYAVADMFHHCTRPQFQISLIGQRNLVNRSVATHLHAVPVFTAEVRESTTVQYDHMSAGVDNEACVGREIDGAGDGEGGVVGDVQVLREVAVEVPSDRG